MKIGKDRSGTCRVILTPAEALVVGKFVHVKPTGLAGFAIEGGKDPLKDRPTNEVSLSANGEYILCLPQSVHGEWPAFGTHEIAYSQSEANKAVLICPTPKLNHPLKAFVPRRRKGKTQAAEPTNWLDDLTSAIATINTLAERHNGEVKLFVMNGKLRAKVQTTVTI